MKKSFLLLPLVAGLAYVTLTSSASGGAMGSGADGTKATGGSGCSCHNTATTTTVTIELDSAGVPVTHYKAGMAYTIKITGTNTSTSSLPRFGFQATVVKSTGAGTSAAVVAGTLGTTGLPTGVRFTSAASGCGIDVLEHNTALVATTGTGASGTTYVTPALPWTAPVAGTGTVKIYGCINAVNFTGGDNGDKYNNASVSITEWPGSTEVATVAATAGFSLFPNPAVGNVTIQLNNANGGPSTLRVYDVTGKMVATQVINAGNNNGTLSLNISDWKTGVYTAIIEQGGVTSHASLVKQ